MKMGVWGVKKIWFSILVLVPLVFLLSCMEEKDNNSVDSNPLNSASASTELEGEWVTKCIDNGDSAYYLRNIIFSGNSFSEVVTEFTNSSCSENKSITQNSGTFTIGASLNTDSGLKAKELDVTRLKVDGIDVNESFYTIFKINDLNMYLGDNESAISVNAPESRLLKLDFNSDFDKTTENLNRGVIATSSSGEINFEGNMPELAKKSGCSACHALEDKVVGPAWIAIAQRYKDDSIVTREALIIKVKTGGGGKWREVTGGVPMPPYSPRVRDDDIAALVDFILILDTEEFNNQEQNNEQQTTDGVIIETPDNASPDEPVISEGEMPSLAIKSGCSACHAIDRNVVGPSWNDISTRYADDSVITRERLIEKVKLGGKGNWTEVTRGVPMPPYSPRVSDENIGNLVDFILSLDN